MTHHPIGTGSTLDDEKQQRNEMREWIRICYPEWIEELNMEMEL